MKKTIKVQQITDKVNSLLASHNISQSEKVGIVILTEWLLAETGNYKGYTGLPDELSSIETLYNRHYIS